MRQNAMAHAAAIVFLLAGIVSPALSLDRTMVLKENNQTEDQDPLAEQYLQWLALTALLTSQYPDYEGVRLAIASDCGQKTSDASEKDLSEFCYCGAVVTTGIWLSDKQSLEAITTYLESPSELNLANLMDLQGPELYTPFCMLVLE